MEVEEEPDSDLETSEDVDLEDQYFWDVTDRSNMKHEVTGLDEERAEAEKGEQSKKKKKNRVKNSAGANLVSQEKEEERSKSSLKKAVAMGYMGTEEEMNMLLSKKAGFSRA